MQALTYIIYFIIRLGLDTQPAEEQMALAYSNECCTHIPDEERSTHMSHFLLSYWKPKQERVILFLLQVDWTLCSISLNQYLLG